MKFLAFLFIFTSLISYAEETNILVKVRGYVSTYKTHNLVSYPLNVNTEKLTFIKDENWEVAKKEITEILKKKTLYFTVKSIEFIVNPDRSELKGVYKELQNDRFIKYSVTTALLNKIQKKYEEAGPQKKNPEVAEKEKDEPVIEKKPEMAADKPKKVILRKSYWDIYD